MTRDLLPPGIDTRIAVAASGCWEWLGNTSRGYGKVYWDGRTQRAHRVIYKLLVGEPPVGLDLDHTCRNRGCVNPAHLEPVTRSENLRRSPLVARQCRAARACQLRRAAGGAIP